MKKKILVTGGCGFIGTNLCIYLTKKHYLVYSLDNLSRKGSKYNLRLLKNLKIKNYNIDISNFKKISLLPKFDLIIDCCAEAAIEKSKTNLDKVISTNLTGTINILKKAKKDKSKGIFLSSSRVYPIKLIHKKLGNINLNKKIKIVHTINEKDDMRGVKSLYGFTKLASEMLIEEFSYAFKLKYIINRCGVISGPLQFGYQDQGFVSLWVWNHMMKKDLKYVDANRQHTNKYRNENKYMVPGFTTSMKSRPLIIDKLAQFIREKSIKINSIRLVEELFVFIFNNGKAEALKGYNDDLVMSMAIGLWIRETALKLHAENIALQREAIKSVDANSGVYKVEEEEDYGWKQHVGDKKESLTWLI